MTLSINRLSTTFVSRLTLNIIRLYDISFHQSTSFSSALSRFTVICHPLFTHLTHSPASVSLLQILTCCGLIPSPGRCLAPAEVVCVLSSLLALVGTSGVMSCLCEQQLLSGFLFLNKPKLRYEPELIFGPKPSYDKNFHFVIYVDTF